MKSTIHGVTAPKGFKANGLCCGIKRSGKPDLALITSDIPALSAGVFTKNSIKAAPLIVSQKHIRNGKTQAIIVNSGNANCFTGKFGLVYAQQTTEVIAQLLHLSPEDVIVTSTGIIGVPLPFAKIKKAAKRLCEGLSKDGGQKAARGILTTDTKIKECSKTVTLGGKKVTIGACAKGSGMIAPNMATMLCFVTTDVNISKPLLKKAFKMATNQSFNCITVDGCMSTNDMVTIMANGLAKNRKITKEGQDFEKFLKALNFICLDLAKKIVLDGEGATKFIEVNVSGAKTQKQAQEIGLIIANSNLVKTAAYGCNPNWGRVAAAVGSLGIKGITEESLKIKFSSFKKKDISIFVTLNLGKASSKAFTSDLSKEYIDINAEYN